MRLVVTGGAGFIGSWTVEALVAAGHDVLVYDSFSTGHRSSLRAVSDAIQVVRSDVRQPLALHRAVRRFRPHTIIHLAACVSVPLSLRHALSSHDTNTRGTLAVLEAARAHGVSRVVLASSAAVYGACSSVPLAEDAPLRPLSPYGLHKRVGEDYARMYTEIYGLETVALRYFNVFGPRQDPASPYSGVIARFVAGAYAHGLLSISGNGMQTRDFVYVGDVARANLAAASADLSGHHIVNVGTGHETSLLQLHAAIARLTGRPIPYTFVPARPGDIPRSCADVTRLHHLFGLTARTEVTDGLTALLDAYGADMRLRSA